VAEAVLELVAQFGAASYETQKVEGHWRHAGIQYRDVLVRLFVDLPEIDRESPLDEGIQESLESSIGADRPMDG
jgi:hypothetical protein